MWTLFWRTVFRNVPVMNRNHWEILRNEAMNADNRQTSQPIVVFDGGSIEKSIDRIVVDAKRCFFHFQFFGPSRGGTPLGPLFFLVSFFDFIIFVFFFNFFPCFPVFPLFFTFFIPFVFLLVSFFYVSSFFNVVSLFLFSGAQNLWRHSWTPWGKVHILSWLYLLCIGSSSLYHVE